MPPKKRKPNLIQSAHSNNNEGEIINVQQLEDKLEESSNNKKQKKTNEDHETKSDIQDMITCSICFDTLFIPVDTDCGHTFCFTCLFKWIQPWLNECKLTCPKCRSVMKSNSPFHQSNYIIRNLISSLKPNLKLPEITSESKVIDFAIKAVAKSAIYMFNMGCIFDPDIEKYFPNHLKCRQIAFELYQKAVNLGYANGKYNLGLCYQRGFGTAIDMIKATQLFFECASIENFNNSAKGHVLAMKKLSELIPFFKAYIYGNSEELSKLVIKLHAEFYNDGIMNIYGKDNDIQIERLTLDIYSRYWSERYNKLKEP